MGKSAGVKCKGGITDRGINDNQHDVDVIVMWWVVVVVVDDECVRVDKGVRETIMICLLR